MENAVHPLIDLFTLSAFRIPQYQRAYAWETTPHLSAFLSDLREQVIAQRRNPDKTYFLGTLLLHEIDKNTVHIVDGQQRLTTSVIFIAAALHRQSSRHVLTDDSIKPKILRRNFIFDEDYGTQKFQTIEEDNPFFRSRILNLGDSALSEDSPSSLRLKHAFKYFTDEVKDDEWNYLISALINAKVMVYSVNSPADATQIFELQNDRGKKLTDLEALKSYLMHLIYLNAKKPDQGLQEIQTQFAKIYRNVEKQGQDGKIPSEDAILSYHCAAYLSWTAAEWRSPKDLIKNTIKALPAKEVTQWILTFVANLQETYKRFTHLFQKLDDYPALAQLIVLDRMATFWPMIIKAYGYDTSALKEGFQLSCRLMEVYAMRAYGISNVRADAGLSPIYTKARNFGGDFSDLHSYLHSMSYWYDLQDRFSRGLDHATIYKSNRRDSQYLLWRYENHLRSQTGKKTSHISWRDYLNPRDEASRISIEHIAAQKNPISTTTVEWVEGEEKEFSEVATHRLGNLVLDSKSANSSKGKYDFSDKLESLSKDSTFLSQGELVNWADKDSGTYHWSMDSIKRRHFALIEFALATWDPNAYFTPITPVVAEECEIGANEMIY